MGVGVDNVSVGAFGWSLADRFDSVGDIVRTVWAAGGDEFPATEETGWDDSLLFFGLRVGSFSNFFFTMVGVGVFH